MSTPGLWMRLPESDPDFGQTFQTRRGLRVCSRPECIILHSEGLGLLFPLDK